MKILKVMAIVALVGYGQSTLAINVAEMQQQILTKAIAESTEEIKALTADVENANTAAVTPRQDIAGRPYLKKEEWKQITMAKLGLENGLLEMLYQLQTHLANNNIESQKNYIRTTLRDIAEYLKNAKPFSKTGLIMEDGRIVTAEPAKQSEVLTRLATVLTQLKEVTVAAKGLALQDAIAESMAKIEELTTDVATAKSAVITPQLDSVGRPRIKKEEWERINTAKLTMEQDLLSKLKKLQSQLTDSDKATQKEIIRMNLNETAAQISDAKLAQKKSTALLLGKSDNVFVVMGESDKRLEVAERLYTTLKQMENELALN